MAHIVLESDLLRARIDPGLGAGIAELSLRRPDGGFAPLMRPAPQGSRWFNDLACYLLAPWPNRIKDGRFQWCGRGYTIHPDWPDGTAIHGLVKDKAFHLVERSPVSALLRYEYHPEPGSWPWAFACDARYELSAQSLSIRLRVTNNDAANPVPMPAGIGFHPFFPRRLWDPRDDVAVRASVQGRYPAEGMIPTGPPRAESTTVNLAAGHPLRDAALDDVFLGSTHGAEIVWNVSGVRLRFSCSEAMGHAVIYTGRPDDTGAMPKSFCFEPVSMVNDGFNLHSRGWERTGIQSLAAGQTMEGRWSLEVVA